MARRETILDAVYGPPPGAAAIATMWSRALVERLLKTVWAAFDDLRGGLFASVDWTDDYDDLERSISQLLEQAIRRKMDGFAPCFVQHGPFERESRAGGRAQPPEYDIAFIWYADERIMWPLEAKVLRSDEDTDRNLGDYVSTLTERFLTCRYAPFSAGGAMLGYLRGGDPETVLGHIAQRLGCSPERYAVLTPRYHWTSEHQRTVPAGKDYPVAFVCHHLIMSLTPAESQ